MSDPAFSNRLVNESSPYLRQHAHNPVNWFPWAEEALTLARELDKPMLVSIGYSACHWCHVMERESFEDPDIADMMNRLFVNIKIDREERPDLDHIYMEAVQVISGNGGWPLHVFLTPDAKPFFGGTYFPPIAAYNRPSWKDILLSIGKAWINQREDILQQADELTLHITRSNNLFKQKVHIAPEPPTSKECASEVAKNLLATADLRHGGFGAAPKFPQVSLMRFLFAYGHFKKDAAALQHAHFSLNKMIRGGIYDQVGGGMARYSVDEYWLVPHFEKMLYDNALLLQVLAEAYQESGDEEYQWAARQTINWLLREMKGKDGGFISALDADSEGKEGKFYLWSEVEFNQVLGEDAAWIGEFYGVTSEGNFEHQNILSREEWVEKFAQKKGVDAELVLNKLEHANQQLLHRRASRIRPGADDKIILSWNAMLVTAFITCGFAFRDESLIGLGENLFAFLERNFLLGDSRLAHGFKNGRVAIPGFLDDYVYLAEAGLAVHEANGKKNSLDVVNSLIINVLNNFIDEESGMCFFTSFEQKDMITRKIEIFDGPCPSGNSILAGLLIRLGQINGIDSWGQKGRQNLRQMQGLVEKYPSSFGNWGFELLAEETNIPEIIISGNGAMEGSRRILTGFLPFRIHQWSVKGDAGTLFQGRKAAENTDYYICHRQYCSPPVKSAEEAVFLLKNLVC